MPYNGSGTFTRPVPSYVYNTVISETDMNTEMDGMAVGLTTALTKDGQTNPTADLPMNGFKHSGVGSATARGEYLDVAQFQDGKIIWSDSGGTADAITANYNPVITSLAEGMLLGVRASAANTTTTPTFSPNGLTARTIVKTGDTALEVGDIAGDNHELLLRYRSADTKWELLNPKYSAFTGGTLDTDLNLADNQLIRALSKDCHGKLEAHGTVSSGTEDFNFEDGNVHSITVGGAHTWTVSNPIASDDFSSMVFMVTNGSAAAITYPASFNWGEDGEPVLGIQDILVAVTYDGGAKYYAYQAYTAT